MMMGYIKHFFWETSQSCYLTTSITALATIASYSLAITLSGSTANVSVLEVSSQPVAIRTVYMQMIYGEILNQMTIFHMLQLTEAQFLSILAWH